MQQLKRRDKGKHPINESKRSNEVSKSRSKPKQRRRRPNPLSIRTVFSALIGISIASIIFYNYSLSSIFEAKHSVNFCDYLGEAVSIDVVNNGSLYQESEKVTDYVLVTGAAGFIGSHVAKSCLEMDMNTIILDDLSGGFLSNIPFVYKRAIFEQGDITNHSLIDSLFKKYGTNGGRIRYIYHLAAYAAEGLSHNIRNFNYKNNLLGSTNLINYAVNYNVSCFVFTSSIAAYGSGPEEHFKGKFDETMHPNPEDPYGISKYAVELDLEAAHSQFGLDSIVFRPHNVYGPNQNIFDNYRNVIGIFIKKLLNNEPMAIFGDGLQTRSFSYIDDVAPYIAASPMFSHLINKKFNIGAEKPYSLVDLTKAILRTFIFDNELIKFVNDQEQLVIFEEYEKIKARKLRPLSEEHIIDELFANERIVIFNEARNEVENAEASHDYFNCMFNIDEQKVKNLRQGLDLTLDWVIKNNYDVATDYHKVSNFRPIYFSSVEVAVNLPQSWAVTAKQANEENAIRITPIAQIHADENAHKYDNYPKWNMSEISPNGKVKEIPVENWGKKYDPLRVWCCVPCLFEFERLAIIQQTWGKYCDKLMFFIGDNTQKEIEIVNVTQPLANGSDFTLYNVVKLKLERSTAPEGRGCFYEKQWKIRQFLYVYHKNDYDWAIRADTDAWFSTPNFKGYAQYFDPNLDWWFGDVYAYFWKKGNFVYQAGGSYAMSRGSVNKLNRIYATKEFLDPVPRGSNYFVCQDLECRGEDWKTAVCLKSVGIFATNSVDRLYRSRWSWHKKGAGLKKRAHSFELYTCCAEHMISFHRYKNVSTLFDDYSKLDTMYSEKSKDNWTDHLLPPKPVTFLFDTKINDEIDEYFNVKNPPKGQKIWKGVDNLWNYTDDECTENAASTSSSSTYDKYPKWNMSEISPNGKVKEIPVKEWGKRYEPLRVWCCVVATMKEFEQMAIIQETWGKYCDKLWFFVGDNTQKEMKIVDLSGMVNGLTYTVHNVVKLTLKYTGTNMKFNDLNEKCWKMYQFIFLNYRNEFDWLIRSDLDSWFSTPNFKGYAQYFDPKMAWWFGNPLTNRLRDSNVVFHAGGLFALSWGSIRKLNRVYETKEYLYNPNPPIGNAWKCQDRAQWSDDVDIGFCLKSVGVFATNSLDTKYRMRWSSSTQQLSKSSVPGNWWYWKDRFELSGYGSQCCADHMIGFHGYKNKKTRFDDFVKLDFEYSEKSKNNWTNHPVPPKPVTYLMNTSIDDEIVDEYFNIANPPNGQKIWKGVDNLWKYLDDEQTRV